ncbi:hypothetical protein BH09PAT3_BH09PAT3_1590 [soil metagenome]
MAKDKNSTTTENNPTDVLEASVDAMMDPRAAKRETAPPLDIFADEQPAAAPVEVVADTPDDIPEESIETPGEDIVVEPLAIDTPQSDAAIDDIVAQEADQVLAAQDAGIEAAQAEAEPYTEVPPKHGHPIFWFMIVLLVVIAITAAYVLTSPGLSVPFAP